MSARQPMERGAGGPPPGKSASYAGFGPLRHMAEIAICPSCAEEVLDPFARRYRYPFIACNDCGPRRELATGVARRRAGTDEPLSDEALPAPCGACRAEMRDPASRRFGAAAISCHACGPHARLVRFDGAAISFDQFSMLDDVDAAGGLIRNGEIVAIETAGGWQLACDATNADTVARLHAGKRRGERPFALMARDIAVIRDYCALSPEEERLLQSAAGPILVLEANGRKRVADAVAPGLSTLGFMLPGTAMHLLMLRRIGRPVIMTGSGIAGEPPITDEAVASQRLAPITPFALVHGGSITSAAVRSVLRFAGGRARMIRRGRGYAHASIPLPPGFEGAPDLLALGGGDVAAACLVHGGEAVLTPPFAAHGDGRTPAADARTPALVSDLLAHRPVAIVTGSDPEHACTALARDLAKRHRLPLIRTQGHHAEIAACLAENGRSLDAAPVLGIALGGAATGEDGSLWGGEFLLAGYGQAERLGTIKPVAMPRHSLPWQSLYAHLIAELGWPDMGMNFADTELFAYLDAQPRAELDAMRKRQADVAPVSSAERLIEAMAAALGICREGQTYPGEAAARLEAMADKTLLRAEDEDYPIAIPNLPGSRLPYIEPLGLWRGVLGDLWLATPAPVISARFHRWLAASIAAMTVKLARRSAPEGPRFDTVALSGACFANRILVAEVVRRLETENFNVLSHALVPPGDAGLALGQAAIGAARLLVRQRKPQGNISCASEFPAAS
jgi:hydrogenase maturation protein HypF